MKKTILALAIILTLASCTTQVAKEEVTAPTDTVVAIDSTVTTPAVVTPELVK